MAKMHTKRHGKAKSRKPAAESLGDIALQEAERQRIEQIIEGYAKQGMSPAMIGEKLKKEHGVKYIKAMMGKRLVQILKEKKLTGELPQDLMDLMKRAVILHKHLERNKHDAYSRTRLQRVESKILRLSNYYRREKVLPAGWKYDPLQAELIIKSKA
ncbi:MAG: 30S ribosomal protein S15 [Candidatus Micrarchaeaceae archaeon]